MAWSVRSLVTALSLATGCFSDAPPLADEDGSSSAGSSSDASTGADDGADSTSSGAEIGSSDTGNVTTSADTEAGPSSSSDTSDTTAGMQVAMRQEIVIDTNGLAEPLVNVPILVRLTPGRVEYDDMRPDGSDLRIHDELDAPLPFEIERWESAGDSLIWVRVPLLVPDMPTSIYLRYGDSDLPERPNPTEVWSDGYVAVWHLGDNSDSSPFALDLSDGTSPPDTVEGVLGPAYEFDAADDAIVAADTLVLDIDETLTIEAWISPAAIEALLDDHRYAASKDLAYRLVAIHRDTASPGFGVQPVASEPLELTTSVELVPDEWRHVAGTFGPAMSGGEAILYVDGVAVDSAVIASSQLVSNSIALALGGAPFLGGLDEVRISDATRSPTWIDVQYRSMADDLLTFLLPEPVG